MRAAFKQNNENGTRETSILLLNPGIVVPGGPFITSCLNGTHTGFLIGRCVHLTFS
jgi:hypothetical protein